MTPRDGDTASERISAETTADDLDADDLDTRERAVAHLRKALDATEDDEKRFHIREALQLLGIDER